MKFVFCFDSFKESMSANQAVEAAYKGWISVFSNAQYERLPLSDGGEGILDTLKESLGGVKKTALVHNAIGIKTRATYLWVASKKTAVVESAQAIGLEHIPPSKRNPWLSSSYGLGELLKAAHKQGAKKIIIGLGGSATVDGGIGMLQALNHTIIDMHNNPIKKGGQALMSIKSIHNEHAYIFKDCHLSIASDVKNPLLGKKGAVMVFATQKGANSQIKNKLEEGMHHYAKKLFSVVKTTKINSMKLFETEGYGAAGGLGASLHLCCNASIHSGIELVLSTINFAQRIKKADLIISGEGKVDIQSFFGKVPWGVVQESNRQNIPTCLIVGTTGKGYDSLYKEGVDSIFTIHKTMEDPKKQWEHIKCVSPHMLTETARDVARIFKRGYQTNTRHKKQARNII